MVIEIVARIQEENIGEAQEVEDCGYSIEKPQGYKYSHDAHPYEMAEELSFRCVRLYPIEHVILPIKIGLYIMNPCFTHSLCEIARCFIKQQGSPQNPLIQITTKKLKRWISNSPKYAQGQPFYLLKQPSTVLSI